MDPQMTVISSPEAPPAIGPYSQAIRAGGFLFCAGQAALDPVTGRMVEGGIREQTRQVLRNLKTVLEAGGSGLDRVVKVTVFVRLEGLSGDERDVCRVFRKRSSAGEVDRSGRTVAARIAGRDGRHRARGLASKP